MSLKRKLLISAVVVLAVAGLAGSCFVLIRGIFQLKDSEQRLGKALKDLSAFYKRESFPSTNNVASSERNVANLEGELKNLVDGMMVGEVKPMQTTPSTFITLLSSKKSELVGKAKQHEVAVVENFAFGFELYDKRENPLPSIEEMPLLTKQLIVIEKVIDIFFQAKVKEINSVVRGDQESKTVTPPQPAGTPVPAAGTPAQDGDKGLFERQRLVFEFKARESAILSVLNQIASNATFMAVSSIQMEKESPDVVGAGVAGGAPRRVRRGEDWVDEDPAPLARKPAALVPRHERIVCGGSDNEKPMKVKMIVDVYTLKGA